MAPASTLWWFIAATAAAVIATAAPAAAAAGGCTANTTAAEVIRGRDLTDRTVAITGGDSGIGFETALALASVNATVVILSYDPVGRGAAAAANITAATGNRKVEVVALDLSSLVSWRMACSRGHARTHARDTRTRTHAHTHTQRTS